MKLKKTFLLLALALVSTWAVAQEKIDYSVYEDKCNFYIANDLGRNGYYDQKPIAELMGVMAEEVGPECVIAAGDIHHFEGVISVQDPLWMTNYELIYAHPELMIAWYPICGNHEYRGSTQAVVDYSRVSRRWEMPGRYYTDARTLLHQVVQRGRHHGAHRVDRHHAPHRQVPPRDGQVSRRLPAGHQCPTGVAGRHPGRRQGRLGSRGGTTILRRHRVDMYINGHIHNFQHIRMKDSGIDYITNSSGSLSRKVQPVEGTVFCSSEPGFSILSASPASLELRMVDKHGQVLHTVTRTK